jgi:hypothetical protein
MRWIGGLGVDDPVSAPLAALVDPAITFAADPVHQARASATSAIIVRAHPGDEQTDRAWAKPPMTFELVLGH